MKTKMREDAAFFPADRRPSREKASSFAVLGMLALGKRQSGYDLKKAIESSTANFWSESYGNLYPALKKLLAEGLIRERSTRERSTRGAGEKSAASKRQKRVYSITDKGRRALRAWLLKPVAPKPEDNEFLLKLFFGSLAVPEESIALVEAHREHHAALLAKFEGIDRHIRAGEASGEQKAYLMAVLRYGQVVSEALVAWSVATERLLRKLES